MFQYQDYKVTMIYAQPRLRNVNWILIFVYSEKCSNNSQICEYKFKKKSWRFKGLRKIIWHAQHMNC